MPRVCSTCNAKDPGCGFRKNRRQCKDCERKFHRDWYKSNRQHAINYQKAKVYRNWGFNLDDYSYTLAKQSFKCGVCCKPFNVKNGKIEARVDHDHLTGKFRSLVHPKCNVGLHYVEDEEFKLAAEKYIKEHRREVVIGDQYSEVQPSLSTSTDTDTKH